MRDADLYQRLLGLGSPWTVGRIELSVEGERVTGIDGLIPDPTLFGGDLHHYLSGAFLGAHAMLAAAPADAACRHCVRAAGVHVVLTGTGSIWHLADIVTAISGDTHVGQ